MSSVAGDPPPIWLGDDLPPSDRTGVTHRMADLVRQWEAAADRRVIFLSCYAVMTRNMMAAIDSGDFHDAVWVHNLLDFFAEYYFAALDSYDRDSGVTPAAWQLAFQSAHNPGCHVLQHLLLGINAHINYDLVLCLGDVLGPEWPHLSPATRHTRYLDHCHVNAVIANSIDAVQDQVVDRYSPLMATVDTIFGRLDEWLMARLIGVWREKVWERALRRIELSAASGREAQRRELDDDVVSLGHLIRLDDYHSILHSLL